VDRRAWLVTDRDFGLRPCTVVDMSDTGARLKIGETERLPRHFGLTFSPSTRDGLRCEIRWRRGRSVGLRFVA
jgi:hypothetical protein